ncbi:hypothetical protein [Bacillus sp. FSL K6-3431]|uniref:hypothetical protein n=1 Tax=Bacillus sp. FSL K6-3431 TaxID=2921500 RepID=UPI0030F8ED85
MDELTKDFPDISGELQNNGDGYYNELLAIFQQNFQGPEEPAITNFMKGLPKDGNVGLRIYGHIGTGRA